MPESLVLLHGFSGTHRAWDGVSERLDRERYLPLALDLPGHGSLTEEPPPITFPVCVRSVLARAPERFVLCGYSLGGRVALHVALAAPERVRRLVLIGANPGIEDPGEREARRASDERLAVDLERIPFEDFIERWRTQPLFAHDPPEVGELARADQRRNRPRPLAAVLRGCGSGSMGPLWSLLDTLTMPVTVVAGCRDEKFVAIARRTALALPDAHLALLPGGHVLPLESPGELAALLEGLDPESGGGG